MKKDVQCNERISVCVVGDGHVGHGARDDDLRPDSTLPLRADENK